jgi:DHA1 family tetracycline resistance protein-like MFS transporter
MDRRRLIPIFIVVLVDMLGFSLVLPLLPFVAERYGASPLVQGLLVSSYPIAQLIGAPILGRLSDRFGRKPMLLVSIAGSAAGFILLGLANTLPLLFAARIIDGLTGGNISIAQAYIADVTDPKDRGRAFGLIGAAFGIGFIIGPLTGGLLAQRGFLWPALAAATLTLANLVLVALILPESLTAERRAVLAREPAGGFRLTDLLTALRRPIVGPLLVVIAVTGFTFSFVQGGFSIWGKAALQLTEQQTGLVLAAVGVLAVFQQAVFIGFITKRARDGAIVAFGVAGAAASLLAWAFVPNIALLVLLLVPMTASFASTGTVSQSALTKAVSSAEIGGSLGLSNGLASATRAAAPLAVGASIAAFGPMGPGLVSGAITALVAVYAFAAVRPMDTILRDREDGAPAPEQGAA